MFLVSMTTFSVYRGLVCHHLYSSFQTSLFFPESGFEQNQNKYLRDFNLMLAIYFYSKNKIE